MTDHPQPLTETQALAWLHGQPDGTIATTVSDLARCWGWNRSTTSRRVKVWVASGHLVRTPGPDGRSIFTARTPDVPLCSLPDYVACIQFRPRFRGKPLQSVAT
jgi:MarR family